MLTVLWLAATTVAPQRIEFNSTIDGVQRTAIIRSPSSKTEPAPLVFVFHGHGGTSRFSERKYPVHELWPEAISIHPQGLPTATKNDPEGRRPGWQTNPGQYGDRDLKLFDRLLAEAKKHGNVDLSRIYVMGHSNGARFTYVLWAKHKDLFAATAPLAAPGTGLVRGISPVSTFVLAGENDPIVSFDGQMISLNLLKENYSFLNKSAERKSGHAVYRRADNGATFATYIHPGKHEVPRDAFEKIIQFFKENRKLKTP